MRLTKSDYRDNEFVASPPIHLEYSHMSCCAQGEQKEEYGRNRNINVDGRPATQNLCHWEVWWTGRPRLRLLLLLFMYISVWEFR